MPFWVKSVRKRIRRKSAKKFGKKFQKWNRKHDVIGLSPDNWVSPIDFTPIGWINKGRRAYKATKTGYKLGKKGFSNYGRKSYKAGRKYAGQSGKTLFNKYGSRKAKKQINKSRRRSSSTSQQSKRRGTQRFYYYRGKRIYRK